jgi:two-component sensor histidine kinase
LSNSPIRQNIQVTVTPPAEPLLIAPRQATALALIINELTTNSLKHAFQERGRGRIEARIAAEGEDGRQVRLEFRNDGPDWPDDVLNGQRENVGLRLVRTTMRSPLRGKMVLCNDNGAVTLICFELAAIVQEPVRKSP